MEKLESKQDYKNETELGCENFPTNIFPQSIQDFIVNAEQTVGYNPEYFSAGILSACATAIGSSVRLFNGSYESPSILWLAIIGRSGAGKTHPLELAKNPIEKSDSKNFKTYQEQLKKYNGDTNIDNPTYTNSILGDYTPEKLIDSLQQNKKGILIFKDELVGWIKSFDRYRNGGDQQMYLELFNGNVVTVDRKTKEPIRIENPIVNVLGSIQPSAIKVMGAKNRNEDGFLARFLFVYPKMTEPSLFTGEKIDSTFIENYESLITSLLDCGPTILKISQNQLDTYKKWQHEKCKKHHNDDIEAMIQSKLETYVWRLGLVIEMMKQAEKKAFNTIVSDESIENAIKLAEYFRINAQRVHNKVSSINPLDKLTQKQVSLFHDLPSEFKRKDAIKKGESYGITGGSLSRFLNYRELFTRVDNAGNYEKKF